MAKKRDVEFDLGLGGFLGGSGELIEQAAKLAEATGDREAKARVAEIKRRLGKKEGKAEAETPQAQEGLGALFGVVGKLIDFATTLKETEETEQIGEFGLGGGKKGMCSFGIRIGSIGGKSGEQFKVESFGHKIQETESGPIIEDWREPEVDVIEEKDYILVVGDMPGAEENDIHFEVRDKTLTITSEGARKYRKEVELPTQIEVEKASLSYRNGVLELKLPKA